MHVLSPELCFHLQATNSIHAPLNPAATHALGGPSKSKDPFADLAGF